MHMESNSLTLLCDASPAGAQRPDMDRQVSGNIVPMSRSMSDRLRLKLCGAEISRAATRQPAELSGDWLTLQ